MSTTARCSSTSKGTTSISRISRTFSTVMHRLQGLVKLLQHSLVSKGKLQQIMLHISLTGGAQIGQQLNNAAAAQASGYVGAGNAFGGAVGNLGQYAMLQNLL